MNAARASASLRHTGIATFCKAPNVLDPAEIDADIAILGVPFDGMASMCPRMPSGAAGASRRLRTVCGPPQITPAKSASRTESVAFG